MSERQAGDNDFEAVFRELLPTAIAAAQRILGERAAAEDAAAEAFARAYAAWRRVGALPFRDAWILRVTVNQAIDAARRRPRWLQARSTPDPSEPATTRLAVAQALRALPRRQRDVVVLRHLGGFSEAEVAEALGLSENSVKTHTARAMSKLRDRLGPSSLDV
ncbi:MAG TPA: sigma-70 family RNA polymerase sigma factor [Acidimicrobiales bacterium]|nr:sigma-70 family RNA polymerase sigma factor [Acidimicrobiales bacterium]